MGYEIVVRIRTVLISVVIALVAFVGGYLFSRAWTPDLPYATPTFALDGSVSVPAFKLPPSDYMSEEAVKMLRLRAAAPMSAPDADKSIEETRSDLDNMLSMFVSTMKDKYPVNIKEASVAGVPVRIFTPKGKAVDPDRVLINLHGGGFSVCWHSCSILESAPIASVGGYRVVSVNYRMAPEARHPAGVEDVVSVYRELMKTYDARRIGIYGCSAGGALTAQAAALLSKEGLPSPGAIGIFGAGATRFRSGDSAYIAAYIDGSFPPPAQDGEKQLSLSRGYFDGADISGPVISPALHPDVLAKFPPTLVTTGTRAMDMSPAVYTNSQLIKAGVNSTLIVAEGMGHCYQYFADYPEAQEAYDATVSFFNEHLDNRDR